MYLYNVQLTRVHGSLLLWKRKIYSICVCAQARACVCPGAWGCACVSVHVALLIHHATLLAAHLSPPHYLINGTIFEKHLLNIKYVF